MTLLTGIVAPLVFSLTLISVAWWPMMPHYYWLIPTSLISIALLIKRCSLIAVVFIAMSVALIQGNLYKHQSEVLYRFGTDITIKGRVDSYFKKITRGYEVELTILSIDGEKLSFFERPSVKLYAPIALTMGDELQALVQLKPVVGVLNQVGFDKEQYYFSNRFLSDIVLADDSHFMVRSTYDWRSKLHRLVTSATKNSIHQGYYLALIFGDRSKLAFEDWARLKHSGLSHLVAISGLHIGIVFAVGYLVGRGALLVLTLLLPIELRYKTTKLRLLLGIFTGLVLAFFYAALGGFATPTVRALLMLVIANSLSIIHIRIMSMTTLLVAASLILTLIPFSAASTSFWLSFLAVSALMVTNSVVSYQFGVRTVLYTHALLCLLFIPIVVSLFQGVAVASPFYNLLFVPWFSFLVVPLLLLATAVTVLLEEESFIWSLVDILMMPFDYSLNLSSWFWINTPSYLAFYAIPLIFAFILRKVVSLKWLALLLILCAVTLPLKQSGQKVSVHFFDVAHGLSVAIKQGDQAVLYDTGRASPTFSMARTVVTPNLLALGVRELHGVIISHADNDHAGGEIELRNYWEPDWVKKPDGMTEEQLCIRGRTWQWKAIRFEALWPPKRVGRAYNPHSCVVLISFAQGENSVHRILLTGDIEKVSEILIARTLSELDVDVMSVPHHGSRTSSSTFLTQLIHAEHVVASTKFRSHWQLPNDLVKQRYLEQGAQWYETGTLGQINFVFFDGELTVSTLRNQNLDPWYRQMLRSRVE
ncbi:DNA internalization-related competence protein ComEC/Rec2 [Vibrio sp. La 4.2.2]|uniref:DNA internalization-related competence protein ComEC/Rec2 n=1 Tax=Vibrio sp. La 4.2.2 TaxID=2998830 RepID=UPI0022CE16A3|nr:DNA internalization-related competence protein ComEC/Rec2 [Vibrio sp. La 4.2.2]MDA0109121.1 DNA internalization-related competence protein ComEC/Rec2 [Vibrio sp. La 4.2.2]